MPDVIVAGGSGGLGSETVRLLASEWRVIASYRSRPVPGGVRADLMSASDRMRLLDAAPELYGLVVMTGNPARGSGETPFHRSHEANYLGPILLAREAADRMKTAGTQGAIVLVSTMQAIAVFAGSTAYAAQKAALIHAARILAKECRGKANVRVNV